MSDSSSASGERAATLCASLLAPSESPPASPTVVDSDDETVRLSPDSDSDTVLLSAESEQESGSPDAGDDAVTVVLPLLVAPSGASLYICDVSALGGSAACVLSSCVEECAMDVCDARDAACEGGVVCDAVMVAASEGVSDTPAVRAPLSFVPESVLSGVEEVEVVVDGGEESGVCGEAPRERCR